MDRSEVTFLVNHLFGDADGRVAAQRIDRAVDRLPGLEGLHLAEAAVDELTMAPLTDIAARKAMRQSAKTHQQEKEQRHAC